MVVVERSSMSTAQQRGRRTVRHDPGTVDDDVAIHTFARQQAVQRGIYQQSRERGEEPHTFQSDQRGDGQQPSRRVHDQQRRIEHTPAHNGRRQQRRQRRQRHAEIHSGLPHQSSSSRRCAETRHYTAEPAAVPLTPAAIHHRLFPRHVRCPIIVDLSYSHASGTLPRPHACTVQEGFPYGTELSRVAGNRHRDHRVRPQARCNPDHHRG